LLGDVTNAYCVGLIPDKLVAATQKFSCIVTFQCKQERDSYWVAITAAAPVGVTVEAQEVRRVSGIVGPLREESALVLTEAPF